MKGPQMSASHDNPRALDPKSSLKKRNDALLTGFKDNKNYSKLANILFRGGGGASLDCRRLQTRGVSKIANICGHPKWINLLKYELTCKEA